MKLVIKKKELIIYYWLISIIFLVFSSWYLGEKVGRLFYNLSY